jgi:hypothetical protein
MGERILNRDERLVAQNAPAVRICRVRLNFSDENHGISAVKLRGFCGNLFVDDPEFHHHSERSYHYPLIQYKRVNEKLMMIGLQDYANVLMNKMASIDAISTPQGTFDVSSKEIDVQTWSVRNMACFYEFATPWIPLNENNYAAFTVMDKEQQKSFLERILVGNTLSCLKGLGIFVNYRVASHIAMFQPLCVRAHDNPFEAFIARFYLNVDLPDFIGLGKSVSKGFGTIRRVS